MNPRVLITGAKGLLGGVLASRLAQSGMQIFSTGRQPHGAHLPNYEPCELSDQRSVSALFSRAQPNVVVHAAGRIHTDTEGLRDFVKDNVVGTANLLDYAEASAVRTFIFISTISVYSGEGPYAEDSPTNSVDPYGWSKRVAELACIHVERAAPRAIVLRAAGLHGHPRKDGVIHSFFQSAREGRPLSLAEPETRVTLTFLEDVVSAIAHVLTLQQPPAGIYNIATVESPSFRELAEQVVSVVGSRSGIEGLATTRQRNRVLTTARLQKEMGFKPAPLAKHLKNYLRVLNLD